MITISAATVTDTRGHDQILVKLQGDIQSYLDAPGESSLRG